MLTCQHVRRLTHGKSPIPVFLQVSPVILRNPVKINDLRCARDQKVALNWWVIGLFGAILTNLCACVFVCEDVAISIFFSTEVHKN